MSSLKAVIFDFYGTLARSTHGYLGGYEHALSRFGYELDPELLVAYELSYDGVEHLEHSSDEASYENWVTARLTRFATSCGVHAADIEQVVAALRRADVGELVAYPDARPTLDALRARGFRIAICSNWGWQLHPYVEQLELSDLVEVVVTSARAGYRKPHPEIYRHVLNKLEVCPDAALFVGDKHNADVEGPMRIGMRAVELWRNERGEPDTASISHRRIETLCELLELSELSPRQGGIARRR